MSSFKRGLRLGKGSRNNAWATPDGEIIKSGMKEHGKVVGFNAEKFNLDPDQIQQDQPDDIELVERAVEEGAIRIVSLNDGFGLMVNKQQVTDKAFQASQKFIKKKRNNIESVTIDYVKGGEGRSRVTGVETVDPRAYINTNSVNDIDNFQPSSTLRHHQGSKNIYKQYLNKKVSFEVLVDSIGVTLYEQNFGGRGWILPDGSFKKLTSLGTETHSDAVRKNPELFGFSGTVARGVNRLAEKQGAIRVTHGATVSYYEPTEKAFQTLRKFAKSLSKGTKIKIEDKQQMEYFDVPRKLISRSLSFEKFQERLRERALIESNQLLEQRVTTEGSKNINGILNRVSASIEFDVVGPQDGFIEVRFDTSNISDENEVKLLEYLKDETRIFIEDDGRNFDLTIQYFLDENQIRVFVEFCCFDASLHDFKLKVSGEAERIKDKLINKGVSIDRFVHESKNINEGRITSGEFILPDGELVNIGDTTHEEFVMDNRELFNIDGKPTSHLDTALHNGAIRLNTGTSNVLNIEFTDPSKQAFQKLRKVLKNRVRVEEVFLDHRSTGNRGMYDRENIARLRSVDALKSKVSEPASTMQRFHGESFQQNNITFSRNQNEGDPEPAGPEPAGFVPLQAQDRKFFTIDMSCFDFESITPDRGSDRNVEFLKELIKEGKPIAPPFLRLYWRTDGGFWEVRSHEGRGRCLAIKEVFGGSNVIPVDIFFKKREDGETVEMRSPTEEMIESLKTDGIIPQQKAPLSDGLVDDKELFLQHIDIKAVKNLP